MVPIDVLSAVLIGEGTLLLQCAEMLLNSGHEIRAIVSSEERVQEWASRQGIWHAELSEAVIEQLSEQPFDYLFSIVNFVVLSAALLALPRRGAINFHDALLPRFAGLNATSWALMQRAKTHGVSWHEMTSRVDAGRILKQQSVPIDPDDTALSLNARCYEAGAQSFGELVEDLATDRVQPVEVDASQRTYYGKYQRPEAACTIFWDRPAEEIAALVAGLTFGPYKNPLGLPKLLIGDTVYIAGEIAVLETPSTGAPGTITQVTTEALQVATGTNDIAVRRLLTQDGQAVSIAEMVARGNVRVGQRLASPDPETAARLTALNATLARHEAFWVERLASLESVGLPYANRSAAPGAPARYERAALTLPADLLASPSAHDAASRADLVVAAFAAFVARLSGTYRFDLAYSDADLRRELDGLASVFATQVPLRVALDQQAPSVAAIQVARAELNEVRQRKTYARDAIARFPELRPLLERGGQPVFPLAVVCTDDLDTYEPAPGTELTLLVSADGTETRWIFDPAVYAAADVAAMQRQYLRVLQQAAHETPLAEVSLLSDEERTQILVQWNETRTAYPETACIHQLIEAQADQAPGKIAVVFEDRQVSYQELDRRANQLAWHLQEHGVRPGSLVGIFLERSVELVVAILGIHKAGAAYVPLDPTYPAERLGFMAEDAGLAVIVTQDRLVQQVPSSTAQIIRIDGDRETLARQRTDRPSSAVTSEDLAYVIYTSGSTGKPKGVMVSHRNAVNFFVGMDERLNHDPDGVWLAVTSLSFDISVLELLWTLSRGFKVVVQADRKTATARALRPRPAVDKEIDFSLFYFASDEGEGVADKYHLLLEGAKFADRHGFSAVWTPERHFHAFGGLYPNPSVASAAIASITERVQIRAGSVVLPLHSPIRVAEEWALVDNLSRGRVGISFAPGWQPNDFAIAPQAFADRKQQMLRDIATVRNLWRGETVPFPGPNGQDVEIRTLPRPVQPELPVWLTAAGSPDTFRLAGEMGAFVLTHLLGQSVEELAEKVATYRRAWREAGHEGSGHVTLMLHTFVGDDEQVVRETVRAPMKEYLRSSVDLIRQAAWSFPAFSNSLQSHGQRPDEIFDSGTLTEEEMDALLDHAFDRYFKSSGLFGTPESCLEIVDRLKGMEIDEIACLIDFGVPSATVLTQLEKLRELRDLCRPGAQDDGDYSIPAQIERHRVTHLQCTPSMANMLLMDERTRAALRPLKNMMVGGEAFPLPLAQQLTEQVSGAVINMYGPTETTIWSSTHRVDEVGTIIPIGRPIANTELYIVDRNLQPVPVGVPGELLIGGDGVVPGYLNRPELTAERFISDPFSGRPGARLYRTGDLARYRPDGTIEFLGRIDHQVKIRGYRIELGEIEALLREHPSVKEAVVIAREDVPGDVRLVGYVIPGDGQTVETTALRDSLKDRLPEFMVPSHVVALDRFPLTPNAKIDRKALPAPSAVEVTVRPAFAAPASDLETTIAGVWRSALNVPEVGVDDNFFDLGGHSLLMVQVQQTLRRALERDLAITDLFRFPTIRSLAAHLGSATNGTATTTTQQGAERADARRDMRELMMRRRQLRQSVTR